MKLSVIGTGYVGLVAGACFSDTGNDVICVDLDTKKIDLLNQGEIPIYEPGLKEIVDRNVKENRLRFTTSLAEAVSQSDVIFLAVGTPARDDGSPEMKYLKAASESVAAALKPGSVVVNKSTAPIHTFHRLKEWMTPKTSVQFDIAINPEFLKEGTAINDFLKPDRVVLGSDSDRALETLKKLYAPFVRQGNPIFCMDPTSAEMTKYAANSFLATRISFMNELSVLCEKMGADIENVRKGMASDPRIGKHFLYAGAGYGGSCFPKDVQALMHTAKHQDVPLRIIVATEDANEAQKHRVGDKVKAYFGSSLKGKTIGVLGLAFKPNTDDIREAPALTLIDEMLKQGAKIRAFDPVAMDNVKKMYPNELTYCSNAYETSDGTDALVIMTEWNEFRNLRFDDLKKRMKNAVIFDGRNLYEPQAVREAGFTYDCIGRK